MSDEIHSRLYKAALLGANSTRFSAMVEAACWHADIPHTPEVTRFCASRVEIIDGLRLVSGESIDEVLSELIQKDKETGEAVDGLITAAVQAYADDNSQ